MVSRTFRTVLLSAALGLVAASATAQVTEPVDTAPEEAIVEGFADILRRSLGPEAVFLSDDEMVMLDAAGLTLDDFRWIARPLVVFADSANDPSFIQQMENIAEDRMRLAERDVVVVVDTDPAARSAIRQELRPRGFMLVLIGKDGFKYLRKPLPWDVREISRSIDKMPLRQQELKDSRGK